MAEKEKKFDKGSKGGASSIGIAGLDAVESFFVLLVAFFMARGIITRLQAFFSSKAPTGNYFIDLARGYLDFLVPFGKIASVGISALSAVGIFYIVYKITKIREEENLIFHHQIKSATEVIKNKKWERIVEHINSPNQNDWKLAILEADIILDEMLDSMGYPGLTIGDKLKGVEKSDFTTIESAWEAHKIRNSIAHEGGDYLINEREARRVIALYEAVFREFNFI